MDAAYTRGKPVHIRGHEVVSHTNCFKDGRYRCLIFFLDPYDPKRDLKVFKGYGANREEAENSALGLALQFLELREGSSETNIAHRNTMCIGGHKVDIFCDTIGEGRYQAFPFLRRPDGTRSLIMQFHLREAVTGETPAIAMNRCIERLSEYFAAQNRSAA